MKLQQRFRSESQSVFTEKVNKIALGINDDKRIQTPDRVISYLYAGRVYKAKLVEYLKMKN